ncbi:MAG: hypothetical protein JWM46_21 [Candidatus Kaiserbacteria bacterium]|nr:hypothetical protein [Candidatus Kaiserbacteria bacterium]
MRERPRAASESKFTTPEEELAYLREQVAQKEKALEVQSSDFERERIAKREVREYAEESPATVLHETIIMPEHETVRQLLKLEPETHDVQLDGLLNIVASRGIRNALSVAARMKNPHLEDDFHRALVRYVSEGLPRKGIPAPEKVMHSLELVLFEVQPQAQGEGTKEESRQAKLEQILSSSDQLYAGLLSFVGHSEGFSLEIAVPEGSEAAALYLAVPHSKKVLAEHLISSIFPNARISESRGDYNIFNYQGAHAAAYASLAHHPAYPLKTAEMFELDPMNVLLSAFSKLAKHGEGAAIQITVGNEGDRYNHHYKKILREVEKGKPLHEAFKVPETELGEALHGIAKSLFSSKVQKEYDKEHDMKRQGDQVATEAIGRKIKTRIAPVSIRLIASGPSGARAEEILNNLIAPFSQFDDPKGNALVFKRVSSWSIAGFLRDYTYRSFESSIAMPLSLGEITAMYHFTAERVTTSRELKRNFSKQSPAPVGIGGEGIVIGINHFGGDETPVHFAPADRLRHTYVIGQTGTGKTGLIKNMILQDIQNGEGVCFIDPHGNDIEDILAAIPPERAKDVIYFDPAYTKRPMGLNMLEYDQSRPEMKTFVIDEVYGIFRKLYSDVPEAFGPMFEQYYRNAVQLVIEDPESGCTFVEVPRVFADAAFRKLKLSKCKNPIVVQFWKKIAEAAGGDAALENIVPYISSKFDVFLSNDIMRPIVSQERSAFNFREIMDGKKIFLANLSKGRLGDRNTSLLGLVLVSKFLQAAFSRADTREVLPTFYMYIDEFQNFATPSISTILSEARKYKLSLTVAHQYIAQLEDDIRDSVIGNVGTKISMRIGTTDAEFLEKQFAPTFNAQDLENLPNRTGVAALLVNGVPAKPFTIETVNLPKIDYTRLDEMKKLSYEKYGRDRAEVEADVDRKFAPVPRPVIDLSAATGL